MTTEHLDMDEDSLDKLLGGTGKDARQDNDDALVKDVAGIDTQITNIAYGASAFIQRKLDRRNALQEEIADRQRQREQIANRAQRMLSTFEEPTPAPPAVPVVPEPPVPPAPVAVEPEPVIPEPVTPPPAPVPEPEPVVVDEDDEDDLLSGLYTADELSGMSNEQLQRLADAYDINIVVTDENRAVVIGRIISAQREWCLENDAADPNGPDRTQVRRFSEYVDVRQWSLIQWVVAIILAFLALLIGLATNNWPEFIENSIPENFFEFFWVAAVTATGFFVGGLIGSLLDRQIYRYRSEHAVVEE